MNFNIYLNNDLAHKVDKYIKNNNMTRSKAISQALYMWLDSNNRVWQANLFDFDPVKDFPDILELRKNLKDIRDDPLL